LFGITDVDAGAQEKQLASFFFVHVGHLHELAIYSKMLLTQSFDIVLHVVARSMQWVKGGGRDALVSGVTFRTLRYWLDIACNALEMEIMDWWLTENDNPADDADVTAQRFRLWVEQNDCERFSALWLFVDGMRTAMMFHGAVRNCDYDLMMVRPLPRQACCCTTPSHC